MYEYLLILTLLSENKSALATEKLQNAEDCKKVGKIFLKQRSKYARSYLCIKITKETK